MTPQQHGVNFIPVSRTLQEDLLNSSLCYYSLQSDKAQSWRMEQGPTMPPTQAPWKNFICFMEAPCQFWHRN